MRAAIGTVLFAIFTLVGPGGNAQRKDKDKNGIESFNQHFVALISKSDDKGMLELWENDGVDLMPGEAPMMGKAAITAWYGEIEAHSSGAKVRKEEVEFHDVQISGDWASQWATEHQVVQAEGKPANEGYGKIALVLHRDASGKWKIKQEMWNDSPKS